MKWLNCHNRNMSFLWGYLTRCRENKIWSGLSPPEWQNCLYQQALISIHPAPLLLKKVRCRSKHSSTCCWLRGWKHGGAPHGSFNCFSKLNHTFTEPKAPFFPTFLLTPSDVTLFFIGHNPKCGFGTVLSLPPNSPLGRLTSPHLCWYVIWPHPTIIQALLTLMNTFSTHKTHIYWTTYGDSYPLKVYNLKEEMLI